VNQTIDIYPISLDLTQYPLAAFRILSPNVKEIGATYAARVRKIRKLPCTWLHEELRIIAPQSFGQHDATTLLHELQRMKLDGFDVIDDVALAVDWQPSANAIAQFIARGVLDLARSYLRETLKQERLAVSDVTIDREGLFKGVVVEGQPALQIHVHSPMGTSRSLEAFYKQHGETRLKGMLIRCKDTTGKWVRVVSKLGDAIDSSGKTRHQQLQDWNPSDYDPAILAELPGDHPVIELKPEHSKKPYYYPLRALRLVVEMGTLGQFGLSEKQIDQVSRELKIAPAERRRLVEKVREGVVGFCAQFYPAIGIAEDYSTTTHPHLFMTAFDQQTATIGRDTDMLAAIKRHGLYRQAAAFEERSEIRVGLLDAIPGNGHHKLRKDQLERFMGVFNELGFTLRRSADPITVNRTDAAERRNEIINGLRKLIRSGPDIILIYLPQSERRLRPDDPTSLYNVAKTVCINDGIPSQVIYENTVVKVQKWADDNILMGILGKTGNIPYVLAEPLDFLDVIVGLDIARKPQGNGGSLNTAAMSRIYLNDGALLGYSVSGGTVVQGETIPVEMLERLLSEDEFSGKRVGIHRDGFFRGDELKAITEWGKVIKAEFYPMEVIKSGAARMYKDENGIQQGEKGMAFHVGEGLSYLVSSPPPAGKSGPFSTAQPLQVRNCSQLTQEQALRSVLALTLLHYGSVRPPRLPVSTHASDKIAGFLLRNIRPDKQKGDVPFWL
jgi:hypothetical protein